MTILDKCDGRKTAITLLMGIAAASIFQMCVIGRAHAATLRRGQLQELRQAPSQSFSEFLSIAKVVTPLVTKSRVTSPMKTLKAPAPLSELIGKEQQSFASLVAVVEADPVPVIKTVVEKAVETVVEKTLSTVVEKPKVDVAPMPKLETPVELQQIASPSEPKLGALSNRQSSIQVSVDEQASTEIVNTTENESDFVVSPTSFRSKSLRLRLIDDRSSVARNKIYPLANVKISIVGQKFSVSTDRLGFAEIDQIPENARVMLNIHDEFGRVRDSSIEVLANTTEGSTKVITMMRHQALETYEAALAVPPTSAAAILCGVVVDQSEQRRPQQGLAIGTDTEGVVGPLYFNKYGFLDRTLQTTGPDGRFCMFNVNPGPTAVHVFQDDTALSTVIIGTFPGSTQHVELTAFDIDAMSTSIGVVASAHEQLGSDPILADSVKLVDMVDLFPIGRGEPMTYTEAGHLEVVDGTTSYLGRSFALVQSGEFENALYELGPDRIDRSRVSIMHPRGFLEDMALYAQISLNPQLGSVVFEHAAFLNETLGVDVMLTDSFGNEVGDGWYYADVPRTKAIFFNLAPGTYNITVKSKSGEWVANDIVHVFNETITMVNTGSPHSERTRSQQ